MSSFVKTLSAIFYASYLSGLALFLLRPARR
jgi:uncharacterized membrane protein